MAGASQGLLTDNACLRPVDGLKAPVRVDSMYNYNPSSERSGAQENRL